MKVRDFMIMNVITAKPTDTIKDVMKIFVEKKIGGVPVVDGEGKLCGIVTDGDILRAIKPIDRQIYNYFTFMTYIAEEDLESRLSEMAGREIIKIAKTNGIVTVHPDDDMKKVVSLLSKHHFKKLPVLNGNNRVIGVLSRGDVIRSIQQTIIDEMD
ncbi:MULTISPECIES: CBS domain-containing protein [Neobacillus]|uniref:CBS domain-containing protein n=1 Tax=Neobacillus rhizophilus TaxID=2833579 RepID=A0A942U216_9BACI|nr:MULTISPECIES: CBS domain-containing protein [Neobacillus]MBS4211357.1 CBS domain-containing protein [Neobacillus rhizophilus]MBU8916775.1 CBS domain-containing protein [Bacillus sp. FJAT-29953]